MFLNSIYSCIILYCNFMTQISGDSLPFPTSTITHHSFEKTTLPEAFDVASEIMRDCILRNLYLEIYNKKTKLKDPDYDYHLPEIQASGTIDIPLVTSAQEIQGLMIFGDRMGSISLYDISRKMVLSKKEVSPGHRITSLTAETLHSGEVSITTVAVVARGDPIVYVYRYRSNDGKLHLSHVIQVSNVEPQEGKSVGDFPLEVKLSKYGLILAVILHNGSIHLYMIPEVKTVVNLPSEVDKLGRSAPTVVAVSVVLDEPPLKINKYDQIIAPICIEKRRTYQDVVSSLMKPVIETPLESVKEEKKVPPPAKGKDDKKDTKNVPILEEKKEEKKPSNVETNQETLYPATFIEEGKDYTPSLLSPKFRPSLYFLTEVICIPGSKQFFQPKSAFVTTKVVVVWTNTTKYCVYSLQSCFPHNTPALLYKALYSSERTQQKDAICLSLVE